MRGTLSQTGMRPDAAPRRRAGRGVALRFGLALAAGALGCSEPGGTTIGATATGASEAAIESVDIAAETRPSEPFAWPEDPSHPVLEVTVEGPGLEGRMLIELMPELAPSSVVGLVELAGSGYYDGTTFHRVIPGFMIQGGDPHSRDRDPTNDGAGPSGRALPDEFSDAPFLRGVVGMGNKGRPGSTSTQLFIMQADKQNLDGRYNAVGRVIDGLQLVDAIARVTTDRSGRWGPRDRPIENVVIRHVRPIGQVAAVRAARHLDTRPDGDAAPGASPVAEAPASSATALARAGDARETPTATSSPPAAPAPGPGEEWERLEAGGR